MTMKLMKNLMLATLTLNEVQADLTSNSSHLSSLLISFSYPFKLDNIERTFSICLEEYVEGCKKVKNPEYPWFHASCMCYSKFYTLTE